MYRTQFWNKAYKSAPRGQAWSSSNRSCIPFSSLSHASSKITSIHDKEAQGTDSVFDSLISASQEWVDASCARQRSRSAIFIFSESLIPDRFYRKYSCPPPPRYSCTGHREYNRFSIYIAEKTMTAHTRDNGGKSLWKKCCGRKKRPD